jgi:hypothetical protein
MARHKSLCKIFLKQSPVLKHRQHVAGIGRISAKVLGMAVGGTGGLVAPTADSGGGMSDVGYTDASKRRISRWIFQNFRQW